MNNEIDFRHAVNDMACSRITFDSDYIVVKADQRAYQFVYEEYTRFDKLIADDDVERFYRYIENEDAPSEQFVVVRMRRRDGVYRPCLIIALRRAYPVNGTKYTDVELRDIVTLNARYKKMDLDVRKYRSIMGMLAEYFFEYNPSDGMFTFFCYRGYRADNIEKADIDEVLKRLIEEKHVDGDNIDKLYMLFEKIKSCEASFTVELETNIFRGGENYELMSFHGQTLYYDNELARVIGIASHVSRIGKATSGELSDDAAEKDSATGILNKKAMTDFVENKIRHFNETGRQEPFWLAICDIDYFKNVNDTYGHLFGDEVIYRFAQTIRTWVGDKGVVGRIGGDEFMIMLDGADDVTELRSILIGIREELEWAFQNKALDYRFTTSIGVANYPKDADDYVRLFKIADKALYIAKEKGRDRFIIYEKELHGELEEEKEGAYAAHTCAELKPIAKAELASNLIFLLTKAGRDVIPHVLDSIIENLNIHGITIYESDADGRIRTSMTAGRYNMSVGDISDIMDSRYLELFNANGINQIHNVKECEIHCPEMYDFWKDHEICSTLQFMIGSNEHVMGIVSFDIFGAHRRKWSENDVNTLYMIVKFIGNALES